MVTQINSKIKIAILVLLGFAIMGTIFFLESKKPKQNVSDTTTNALVNIPVMPKEEKTKKYPAAREIADPQGYINTQSITVSELIGQKVVLVDFWTYSCINCQRTTPYLNSWYEKYKDKGLEILGIHTPEFEFEKKYENVKMAVQKYGIRYPVILDNNYATWKVYENRYWPRKYLIDIDGYIVFDHIGEGAYEETETKIQELLEERMMRLDIKGEVTKNITRPIAPESSNGFMPRSPEVYFGSGRNEYFGSGQPYTSGVETFPQPKEIITNKLYLIGTWDIQNEFSENKKSEAKIIFRYQGKEVYMVASAKNSMQLTIQRDGESLREDAGEDIIINTTDKKSIMIIKEDRLYTIIQDQNYGEHTLEITIEDPGLQAFTFTFG